MEQDFDFAYVEYYQVPKKQKQILQDQDEQQIQKEIQTPILQMNKKLRSKQFNYSLDSLTDRFQEIGSLDEIQFLKFNVNDQQKFNVVTETFASLPNMKKLQCNFIQRWFLEILSEYTSDRYWYNENDRIDRVEDEESNFAQEFKHFVNLTHLELNFENTIFSQVLGDFAKIIQNYKQLEFLSLNIPHLFTFMDQTTSARILKGFSCLDNLKEFVIKFGYINKRDSEFIKTMAEAISNQSNLEILNISLNTEITEEVAHKIVECICRLKKLTSLQFQVESIQSKKSLNSIFKPIYSHEQLQNISINIKQQDCFNLIQNMSIMPSIQNLQIIFSNQKKLDIQNTLFNASMIQKLVGLHIQFNDKLILKQNTLNDLGKSLLQFEQIQDLSLKFNSENQIVQKEMSVLLDSLTFFTEMRKFSFHIGKGNILNTENILKIANILSLMNNLIKLSLGIIETQFIDANCIKSIYESICQMNQIQNLSIDIKNINSLIFLNLINIFPQFNTQTFEIKHITLSFDRKSLINQQNSQQSTYEEFYLSFTDTQIPGNYEVQSFGLFQSINSLYLSIPSNKQLISDLFGSLKNVKQVQQFRLKIENTIYEEEMNDISNAFFEMTNIQKLNLQIKQANVKSETYQGFVNSLCNLKKLNKFYFFFPKNEVDISATNYLFENLKQFQYLEKVKIYLGQLNSIQPCASQFDQLVSQFFKNNVCEIHANLILNNSTAFQQAEVIKHLKSIQNAKFTAVVQSYYELKLFLEKGVKHMVNLRTFKMENNILVDQNRISKQKSNIIRKALRLVNLSIT